METATYKRLIDCRGHFVGFQRTIIEYLPAGNEEWQLEPIYHDDQLSTKIDRPPHNIISMERPEENKKKKKKKKYNPTYPRFCTQCSVHCYQKTCPTCMSPTIKLIGKNI